MPLRIYSAAAAGYGMVALRVSATSFDLALYPVPGEAISATCQDAWDSIRQGWHGTRTWAIFRPFHRIGLRSVHVTVRDPNEQTIVQADGGIRAEFREGGARLVFAFGLSAILVPIAIATLKGGSRTSAIIGLAPLVGNYLWDLGARIWNGRRGRLTWYVV